MWLERSTAEGKLSPFYYYKLLEAWKENSVKSSHLHFKQIVFISIFPVDSGNWGLLRRFHNSVLMFLLSLCGKWLDCVALRCGNDLDGGWGDYEGRDAARLKSRHCGNIVCLWHKLCSGLDQTVCQIWSDTDPVHILIQYHTSLIIIHLHQLKDDAFSKLGPVQYISFSSFHISPLLNLFHIS